MSFFDKVANWYFTKKAVPFWAILFLDCLFVGGSCFIGYAIDNSILLLTENFWPLFCKTLLHLIPFVVGFRIFRTYLGVARFTSFPDLYRIGLANIVGFVILAIIHWTTPFSAYLVKTNVRDVLLATFLSTALMFLMRIIIKTLYEYMQKTEATKPVFIYGVKNGGLGIARAIQTERGQKFHLCGFVSDSSDMPGKRLMGVDVYPNNERLPAVMRLKGVRTLLVSPLKRSELSNNPVMTNRLIKSGIKIYTLNHAMQWDGKSDIATSQLREVEIEDLLPRDEIMVDLQAVEDLLRGKRVLVTGSAGSIGSEIVRQVAKFDPEQMILIDQAETPQHDIRLFMAKYFPEIKAETIVTTICNSSRMEALFKMYKPHYVFHAAAYKHVPMMEDNPCEAVQNNIDGTKILADLSVKYGVKKFVMISTDKAVNPTNVMGCSKRICEIYVQSLDKAIKEGKIQGETQFVTTRFGNVLGSNGSVIPLFKEQIKNGGPVTVTHPNIFRYFMLIPEACKLVLEAGTMGHGGEIFVFDMGEPVKIADLAKRMILLSGATHVSIEYTGLRDGEKLYEEVLNDKEVTKPTFNKKIKIASVREYDFVSVREKIESLIENSHDYDIMKTVAQMKLLVPEFKSNHSVYETLDKK